MNPYLNPYTQLPARSIIAHLRELRHNVLRDEVDGHLVLSPAGHDDVSVDLRGRVFSDLLTEVNLLPKY